ncbi:hypothetical protein KIPB_016140, partial [Kipferlia bialata]|eukprot:g16140.t1
MDTRTEELERVVVQHGQKITSLVDKKAETDTSLESLSNLTRQHEAQ